MLVALLPQRTHTVCAEPAVTPVQTLLLHQCFASAGKHAQTAHSAETSHLRQMVTLGRLATGDPLKICMIEDCSNDP